jgi:cytochrome c-type biogenesis protein
MYMEIANLSLAFSAGLIAVLAPCALPMLPSFISYYMDSEENRNFWSAITFGFITVLGFLTIFLLIGLLPSFALNSLASRIELVTPSIGIILVLLGLGNLFSDFFYNIPVIQTAAPRGRGVKAFYLYGLGYGAASMACSFPIFVLLVLQSVTVAGPFSILLMFLSYGLGAATIIVPLSIALTYSREMIYRRLVTLLPHMKKINVIILILAGIYMILYGLT